MLTSYIVSSGSQLGIQFAGPNGVGNANAGIHIKPMPIDELEQALGIDIYIRMMTDAKVKAGDGVLRASILDTPIQIAACIKEDDEDYSDKQKAYAENIAEFIRANLEKLPQGFQQVSYQLLEGISMGYKLVEQVYEVKTIIPKNGKQTCLAGLYPKPQEAVSIVSDQYNEVLGYIPRLAGTGLVANYDFGGLGVLTQEQADAGITMLDLPEMVRKEKIIHFKWMARNDNPVGTSHLRAAYVPWRLKVGLYQAWEAFLARFAQPSVAWELEGADLPTSVTLPSGQVLNTPSAIAQQLLLNLKAFQAGGTLIVPVGHLALLESQEGTDIFMQAFEMVDQQITASIQYANLATEGGKYGTQALGEVHQDTKGLLVSIGKIVYADCIREELVRPLVFYNYGEEGLQYLPEVSFGKTEQQDLATMSTAYASLKGAGLVFVEQYPDMYKGLQMHALDPETLALLKKKQSAELAAAITMAANPMGQPGQPGAPGQGGQPGSPQSAQNGSGATQGAGAVRGQGGSKPTPQNGSQSDEQPKPDSSRW